MEIKGFKAPRDADALLGAILDDYRKILGLIDQWNKDISEGTATRNRLKVLAVEIKKAVAAMDNSRMDLENYTHKLNGRVKNFIDDQENEVRRGAL